MTDQHHEPSALPVKVQHHTIAKRSKVTNYEKAIHATWIEDYIQHLKEYDDLPIPPQVDTADCFHVIPPLGSMAKESHYIAFREDKFLSLRAQFHEESDSNKPLNRYMDSIDVMKLSANYRLKGAWVQLMSTFNSQLFMTVAFRDRFSHAAVIEASRMLIRRLNRAIWGKEEGEPGKFLSGYVVLEPHAKRKGHVGFLHVHFVIDYNPTITSADFLHEVLKKEIKKIRWPAPLKTTRFRRRMIAMESIDVRDVTGRRGLAMYLSKCLTTGRTDTAANIMFIDRAGMTGVFSQRQKGAGF